MKFRELIEQLKDDGWVHVCLPEFLMSSELIQRYESGAEQPLRGIRGLSRDELLSHPVPGTWSVQTLVVHLMDSEAVAIDRMKRIIAMERPLLIGYDETAFARSLFYEEMDLALVAEVFRINRVLMAAILKRVPEDAWQRWGVHNEHGRMSLTQLVKGHCEHLDHHMTFLNAKRAAMGK